MSRLSRLRQAIAAHENTPPPPQAQPQQSGQITLDQLVPMLQQSNPTQYAIGVSEDPPMVCFALKVGPIQIPCDLTLEKAEELLVKFDETIDKIRPKPIDEVSDEVLPAALAELLTEARANVEAK